MRKGENIRKRKDNRWEARFYNATSQKYVSVYAKSYSEVKQKASDARISHQKNIKLNHLTVEATVNMWLSGIKDTRKQSTYAKYHDIVHNHIIPEIGKVKLNKVNQDMIDYFIKNKYLNGRIDKRGGLSSKTIKDIINVLKQALQKNNLHFIYEVPNYKRKELSILTNKEYYLFLNHLLFNTDSEKLGLLVALFCGLRLGELCALTWNNIDIETGIIHINKTMQRIKNVDDHTNKKTHIIIDAPKTTTSIRDIPLQSFLWEIMKKMKQTEDCYLLTGTEIYLDPRTLQNRFKSYLKECKLKEINFHGLRHTFATKCMENNFDMKSLSEILGHRDVKFTMNCYVHSSTEHKRNQMEKLSVLF